MVGRHPFDSESDMSSAELSVNFPPQAQLSEAVKDLITRLLQPDYRQRLKASEALTHPWITHGSQVAPEAPLPEASMERMRVFHYRSVLLKAACLLVAKESQQTRLSGHARLVSAYLLAAGHVGQPAAATNSSSLSAASTETNDINVSVYSSEAASDVTSTHIWRELAEEKRPTNGCFRATSLATLLRWLLDTCRSRPPTPDASVYSDPNSLSYPTPPSLLKPVVSSPTLAMSEHLLSSAGDESGHTSSCDTSITASSSFSEHVPRSQNSVIINSEAWRYRTPQEDDNNLLNIDLTCTSSLQSLPQPSEIWLHHRRISQVLQKVQDVVEYEGSEIGESNYSYFTENEYQQAPPPPLTKDKSDILRREISFERFEEWCRHAAVLEELYNY